MNLFRITGFLALITFISCDDGLEQISSASVQFEKSSVSFSENDEKITIKINLSNSVKKDGEIIVHLSDVPASRLVTIPSLVNGEMKISIPAGQSSISFEIMPVDNSEQDGDITFDMTLTSLSNHITIGSTEKLNVQLIDDEGSLSVVQFEHAELTVVESAGNFSVRIVYSKPAPAHGFISLLVESSSSKDSYSTAPAINNNYIRIPYQAGQTESYFDVIPADNPLIEADRVLSLTIAEVAPGVIIGTTNTLIVTITDDYSNPIVYANFLNANGHIQENLAEFVLPIALSHAITSSGTIEVSYVSASAVYGVDFLTDPVSVNGKIILPVVAGQEIAEIRIFPINDQKFNGTRIIDFIISHGTGSVTPGPQAAHHAVIHDDELTGLGKSYETFAGNWRTKRVQEFNEHGKISKVYWNRNTPGYSEGVFTYTYSQGGLLTKLVEGPGVEKIFTWENKQIVKAEKFVNGVLKQYIIYGYDHAGNIGESAVYDIQPDGHFVMSLLFVYLYYNNGNLYRQLTYSPGTESEEPVLISTRTYENYYLEKVNPFPIEIIPNVNSQPNLPGTYRLEENNYNILYTFSYQFDDAGRPIKRTTTSSAGSEFTNYEYFN